MKEYKWNKSRFIIIACITLILIGFEYIFINNQKKAIIRNSADAFEKALIIEKTNLLENMTLSYNENKSPDTIPGMEKFEWMFQHTLTMENPKRTSLNSTYRLQLAQQNISAPTAIYCKDEEVTTDSIPSHYTLVAKHKWRLNTNPEKDIILKAYMEITPALYWEKWYTYLLLGIWVISAGCVFYFLKPTRDVEQYPSDDAPTAPTGQSTDKRQKLSSYIEISKGYYWNQINTLRYKDNEVTLKGIPLDYFKAFIKAEEFLLTYPQIAKVHKINHNETDKNNNAKDRIYHINQQLNKVLKELDIEIINIRGTGYQLRFSTQEQEADAVR